MMKSFFFIKILNFLEILFLCGVIYTYILVFFYPTSFKAVGLFLLTNTALVINSVNLAMMDSLTKKDVDNGKTNKN